MKPSIRKPITRHLPILILILLNLLLGVMVVRDYGESWDESGIYTYGDESLQAYSNLFKIEKQPSLVNTNAASGIPQYADNYGPAYAMITTLLAHGLHTIIPAWSLINGWHWGEFIAFQISILSLYFLARKWMGGWAATGTALLFSTQPLLWGHAFINPKDIPFLAFFLASVTTGIYMIDALPAPLDQGSIPSPKSALRLFINPGVLAAGFVLGFTTSIRVAGPYAGLIVLAYAFYRSWRKAVLLILPYTIIALLTTYLTWPYLWPDAVNRFIASMTLMSHFPRHGPVLFRGVLYPPGNLPRRFLPYLMSVQLTEVVPILFLCGSILSAWHLIKGRQVEPFAILLLWFILPLFGIVVNKSVLYDNFRQELFLLPPVFISAGIALEVLFSKVKKVGIRVLLLAGLILPGIYADVQLHPYQYIYYNGFVGGVSGAFRNFDLDYWATSYREAALYLNQVAPVDATIVVSDPLPVFQDYARPDLKLVLLSNLKPDVHYDFIVLNSRENKDTTICRSISPAKTISRGGAILTVIKAPPLSVEGCP